MQVGLLSTGHYDTMFYSSVDKSGYHTSIAMAEDEEVGYNKKSHGTTIIIMVVVAMVIWL